MDITFKCERRHVHVRRFGHETGIPDRYIVIVTDMFVCLCLCVLKNHVERSNPLSIFVTSLERGIFARNRSPPCRTHTIRFYVDVQVRGIRVRDFV